MASNYAWLKPRVNKLIELAKPFKTIYPDVFYQTGPWSTIKLLTLLRFVPIYTKIIKSPKQAQYFDNMYYIDLLSGSGLCKVGKKGDVIAGSALIAASMCYHEFDQYFLVEQNTLQREALEARLKKKTCNLTIYNCDCNDCVGNIVEQMLERSHYLAFVDCEGLDVGWSNMKILFEKQGDVLFNFQTSSVARLPQKVKNRVAGWKATEKKLNWFFGDDRWKVCHSHEEFLNAYTNKIREETNRQIVLPLPVKGPRGYRYDIILATRRTRGGSPWIKPMKELQEKMGGYRPEVVKTALDIITKRQLSLNDLSVSEREKKEREKTSRARDVG